MQMTDGLPPVPPGVDHRPEARIRHVLGNRELARQKEDLSEEVSLTHLRRGERGDMILGDDENVDGRLRIDVTEGHEPLSVVHDVGRYLTRGDPAEQTVGVAHQPRLTPCGARRETASGKSRPRDAWRRSGPRGSFTAHLRRRRHAPTGRIR